MAYEAEREPGETPRGYFTRLSATRVTEILGDAADLGAERFRAEDGEDLGTGLPFRVVRGKGECAS